MGWWGMQSARQPASPTPTTAKAPAYASWPQSMIWMGALVLPVGELPFASMARTISMPFVTWPNTQCLPFRCGVATVVTKKESCAFERG